MGTAYLLRAWLEVYPSLGLMIFWMNDFTYWRIWKIQMRSKVNDWWIWCSQTCKHTFDTESGPRLLRDFKLDEAEINEAMADSGRPLNSNEAASRIQVESLKKCLSGRTVPEIQIYATWIHLDLITPVSCWFWRFKSCYLPWLRTSEMWNLKLNILHHFWAPPLKPFPGNLTTKIIVSSTHRTRWHFFF